VNNVKHLELAKKIAKTSNHRKSRHGAVLVRGGSILNFAKNSLRYARFPQRFMSYEQNWYCTHHAEIACILGLPKQVTKGATIYVARVGKDGDIKNSKPCCVCQSVLKHVGVKRAIYTTDGDGVDSIKF
jgi:tRNA(Arg) A34 adenosine deaminase TadA